MKNLGGCTFIFMGISGGGKGTHSRMLIDELSTRFPNNTIVYFESGKYHRTLAEEGKSSSTNLKETLKAGKLASDDIGNKAVLSIFSKTSKNSFVVLDGYPRTPYQINFFDEKLRNYRSGPIIVINLKISEDVAISRLVKRDLIEKREDSNPNAIAERITWFKTTVEPAIIMCKESENYHYVEIDGEQLVSEAFTDIMNFCDKFLF